MIYRGVNDDQNLIISKSYGFLQLIKLSLHWFNIMDFDFLLRPQQFANFNRLHHQIPHFLFPSLNFFKNTFDLIHRVSNTLLSFYKLVQIIYDSLRVKPIFISNQLLRACIWLAGVRISRKLAWVQRCHYPMQRASISTWRRCLLDKANELIYINLSLSTLVQCFYEFFEIYSATMIW